MLGEPLHKCSTRDYVTPVIWCGRYAGNSPACNEGVPLIRGKARSQTEDFSQAKILMRCWHGRTPQLRSTAGCRLFMEGLSLKLRGQLAVVSRTPLRLGSADSSIVPVPKNLSRTFFCPPPDSAGQAVCAHRQTSHLAFPQLDDWRGFSA